MCSPEAAAIASKKHFCMLFSGIIKCGLLCAMEKQHVQALVDGQPNTIDSQSFLSLEKQEGFPCLPVGPQTDLLVVLSR